MFRSSIVQSLRCTSFRAASSAYTVVSLQTNIKGRSLCTPAAAPKIAMSLIQDLRSRTGAGVTDCKKALEATNSDVTAATTWLRDKGKLTANKLSGRVAAEGVVALAASGNKGVILEMNSETDFVSRGDYFRDLAHKIAHSSLSSDKIPSSKFQPIAIDDVNTLHVEVAPDEPGQPTSRLPVADAIIRVIGKVKENVKLRRVHGISVGSGAVGGYLHSGDGDKRGGKMGALVVLESDSNRKDELANIATHVATHVVGLKPEYINKEEIPQGVIKNKIENSKTKVGEKNVVEDLALMEQKYFLGDGEETVGEFLKKEAKRLGAGYIKVHAFERLVVGEGIEKKEDDFVKQVMDAMKK